MAEPSKTLASLQSKLLAAQKCHPAAVQTLISEALDTLDEIARAPQAVAAQAPTDNWINADDVSRLARDLDVALHGEDEAAPQASLCDVVGLVKEAAQRLGRPILAAQAAPAAVAVPEGWKLVPLQDTPKMWTAGGQAIKSCGGHDRDAASLAYKAMLEAAPTPALPATEDSSAGDLAEGQPEPVATVKSWTSGSYHRNYQLEWHKDVPEGAQLFAAPQAQPADAPIAYLQESDQHLLHRFIETTEDDESFDIGKDAVKRLANLGVVESCGFGRYGVTMFGYWVHEHYWHQNPSLPLKTNADRDREHRAAMAAAQPCRYTLDQGLPLLQEGQENDYGTCTIDVTMAAAQEGGNAAKEA